MSEKNPYVIIRTDTAGVHIGHLKSKEQAKGSGHYAVVLENARRLWSWAGANTLSELAVKGSEKPSECKFTMEVPSIDLMAIEVIQTTAAGEKALKSIPIWV